jgi:hypothetical protein
VVNRSLEACFALISESPLFSTARRLAGTNWFGFTNVERVKDFRGKARSYHASDCCVKKLHVRKRSAFSVQRSAPETAEFLLGDVRKRDSLPTLC